MTFKAQCCLWAGVAVLSLAFISGRFYLFIIGICFLLLALVYETDANARREEKLARKRLERKWLRTTSTHDKSVKKFPCTKTQMDCACFECENNLKCERIELEEYDAVS